jgi:hypothetical protein
MNPKTSVLTKIYYADDVDSARSQVIYVQEIPILEEAAEAIAYNALDFESERQEQGTKAATTIEVPILYSETQHDTLKAISDAKSEKVWFIEYPEATAVTPGSPLVKYFTGTMNLVGEAIAINEMLLDKITLYRNSDITEQKGLPVVTP